MQQKYILAKAVLKNIFPVKSEEELALAGVEALADFIKEIGLPTTLRELLNEKTDSTCSMWINETVRFWEGQVDQDESDVEDEDQY